MYRSVNCNDERSLYPLVLINHHRYKQLHILIYFVRIIYTQAHACDYVNDR